MKDWKRNLPAVGLSLGIVILWQGIAMLINAAYILPSPIQILLRLWELREPLFLVHLPSTLFVTVMGMVISVVLGLGLAVAMDMSTSVKNAIYPIVIASQTIPTTAIAPLFVLWFGYGIWSKILVTILITFFPITITVFDGFQSAKREMEELLITYGAGKWEIFYRLKLPSALPNFFSAMKMAIPLSIIGAAIGEWLGSQSGLGYFSKRMMTQLDGAGVFAPIVLLSAVAMILVEIVTFIEKRMIGWRKEL
ncbi:MAG: ABC transporter permease [Clostridiales bacterium]|nr:ABC transporter permease [Clostridiales bacterium]